VSYKTRHWTVTRLPYTCWFAFSIVSRTCSTMPS
jgi:hypothetical protein